MTARPCAKPAQIDLGPAISETHLDRLPGGKAVERDVNMTSTRKTLTRAADLVAAGLLSYERLGPIAEVVERYALSLTADVVGLIDRADQRDPIGRQFIPDPAELNISPEERADPIGDGAHTPIEGSCIAIPTGCCSSRCMSARCIAVFVSAGRWLAVRARSPARGLRAALDYVRSHQEIWEVILSGGDPLVLSTRRLETIFQAFAAIEHVKIIRCIPGSCGCAGAGHALARARDQGSGKGHLCRAACEPRARAQLQGARRLRAFRRCRHSHAQPDCAVARRQR